MNFYNEVKKKNKFTPVQSNMPSCCKRLKKYNVDTFYACDNFYGREYMQDLFANNEVSSKKKIATHQILKTNEKRSHHINLNEFTDNCKI